MKTHTTKALFAVTATVLGVAALALSALAEAPASEHPRPDNRTGIRGPSNPAAVPVANLSVRPDDRAGVRGSRGPTAAPNVGQVHPDDHAGLRATSVASVIGFLAFPAINEKIPPRATRIGNALVLMIPMQRIDPGDRRPR